MAENSKKTFFDFLILLAKKKKIIVLFGVVTLILSYLFIYFFIKPQFSSKSVIIPSETSSIGISGLLSNFGDGANLPFGIGGFSNPEMGMYNAIIYSRTTLENIIEKFNLIEVYDIDNTAIDAKELAIKSLSENIETEETENMSFEIMVTAPDTMLTADINNYIIKILNKRLIEINISKSSDNRIFLENRLDEIKSNLRRAEDSLRYYQEKTGLLSVEPQISENIKAYTTLETTLIQKELEFSTMETILNKNSPQLEKLKIELNNLREKISNLKSKGRKTGVILGLENLPELTLKYYRHFRDVEVNNAILEYVIPLYEQAKLEEQKDIPVLKVIDYAVPPAKKSYPPRLVFTLLITSVMITLLIIYFLIISNIKHKNSDKIILLKRELSKW